MRYETFSKKKIYNFLKILNAFTQIFSNFFFAKINSRASLSSINKSYYFPFIARATVEFHSRVNDLMIETRD